MGKTVTGKGCWWFAASLPLLLFLLLPVVALIRAGMPSSVLTELHAPETLQAIGVSLRTTAISLFLVVVLGTPVAYSLGRFSFPGRSLVEALVTLPAVLPPSAAGLALLLAFGRMGMLGSTLEGMGITIGFTPLAVIFAQVFVATPFYIREASTAFADSRPSLEEAAVLDGASAPKLFSRITLPLVAPHLVTGATLAWARALGEFGATILFAGSLPGSTQTMPLAVYLGFEESLERATALALLLLVIAAVVLVVVHYSLRLARAKIA